MMRNEGKLISNLVRFYRNACTLYLKEVKSDNIFIYWMNGRGIVSRKKINVGWIRLILTFPRDYYYLLVIKFLLN